MSLGRHHPLLPKRNLHCAGHSVKAARVVPHPVGHELTYTPDDAKKWRFPKCILSYAACESGWGITYWQPQRTQLTFQLS